MNNPNNKEPSQFEKDYQAACEPYGDLCFDDHALSIDDYWLCLRDLLFTMLAQNLTTENIEFASNHYLELKNAGLW